MTNRETVINDSKCCTSEFKLQPFLFQFQSESGFKLMSLFKHLKNNHYHMVLCSGDDASGFICIAAREIPNDEDLMMRLPVDMKLLAERFDVKFNGLKRVELNTQQNHMFKTI